ncbi:sucrose phosphorylase [Pelagicoccus sp. SDUM812003]|uniref:sucrose phosphorylase n=1 Tax=Pelagicoccus sp. SDUM812003 TaxID=3041267 RepID=UPI00280EC3D4|nr:sucrose phosphorylase [Pelagicoccus sp. SDUM812003]MDQ8201511.1 sucrose phosphorylase [Pelagicoccus sp. SDUM812003]
MKNGIQLITYANSLGGNLSQLDRFLKTHGKDTLSGAHILPFFPSSADRGFAPLTYEEVDPVFGTWNDIESISSRVDLAVDFMANHLSQQSREFQDFLQRKDQSPWKDFFLRYKNLWPDGEAPAADLAKIYTRKPRPPYFEATFADGSTEKIWCTFDYEQIDLDLRQDVTKEFFRQTIGGLVNRGAKIIRLDAFAYTTKRPGTNCFFLEPDVWEVLEFCDQIAAEGGAILLPEIHEHYSIQLKLAEKGYWVYDFALPMLVLHTLYSGSAKRLKDWFEICPRKQFTTLDTHDGIGVVDVADLLTPEEIEATKDALFKQGANVKAIYNSASFGNLDIYQLNCTYYSALGNDDARYLIARLLQFFAPGIPQIYYVGMLAGKNDIKLVESTRNGRDINRHDYSNEEIEAEIQRPVVQQLFQLMKLRNNHPAFDAELRILPSEDHQLHLRYESGPHFCETRIDLQSMQATVTASATETLEVPQELGIGHALAE